MIMHRHMLMCIRTYFRDLICSRGISPRIGDSPPRPMGSQGSPCIWVLPRASWLTPATLQRGVPLFSLEREAREEEHLVPPMCWVPTHPQHWQRPATPHTMCGVSQLLPPLSRIPSGSFLSATARSHGKLSRAPLTIRGLSLPFKFSI